MTSDVVLAGPQPDEERLRAQVVTAIQQLRGSEGELMNVQSSDTSLRRLDGSRDVAARGLVGSDPGDLVGTTPVSQRERAFDVVAEYPAEVAAIAQARRQLQQLMVLTGLAAIADAVTLGAHELMANAVTHGCRRQSGEMFSLRVIHVSGRIRVEVQDSSDRRPFLRPPSDEREGGRGLFLVDALATDWGVRPDPLRGKTVWMELDVPDERATSSSSSAAARRGRRMSHDPVE
ncbi:ATP-binding protein [Streptomyces antibioticus]|uniref:ATP-binding protein n=1 Tax=Streptomyces antibioticus TaxID=1890 RepID=UPI0036FB0FA9